MTLRIGIDVGGTNTDAVLIDGSRIVRGIKTSTTDDIMTGVLRALRLVVADGVEPQSISAVMIGTTQFLNAVVERRELARVAAIRISLPAASRVPPFADWPRDLRTLVEGAVFHVRGGHEVDGRPIAAFDHRAVREAAKEIRSLGIAVVGITASFSPLSAVDELAAAAIVREEIPGVSLTCSHRLGRIGLLARENVTLLNASLSVLAARVIHGFEDAIRVSGITAPLYITQNDGTLVRAEAAIAHPVLCFGSGATNSLRGAAYLSGLSEAIVSDVGGTTTDIGALTNGFPREANNVVYIGGVRSMFRMPDVISLGLGGGTLVNPADPHDIGPTSLGYRLGRDALVYGGAVLTCTDIAVAAGLTDLGDRSRTNHLDGAFVQAAIDRMHAISADAIDRMKSNAASLPLIAVGGASFLVPDEVPGIPRVVRVNEPGVANAVGAAMAQVSGEADQIFTELSRDEAIAAARKLAEVRACAAGAAPGSLELIEAEDLPIAYMPGNSRRIRVRVVGSIDHDAVMREEPPA